MRTNRIPLTDTCLKDRAISLGTGQPHATKEIEKALAWQFEQARRRTNGRSFRLLIPITRSQRPTELKDLLGTLATDSWPTLRCLFIDPHQRLDSLAAQIDPRIRPGPRTASFVNLLDQLHLAPAVQRTETFSEEAFDHDMGCWWGILPPRIRPQPGLFHALAMEPVTGDLLIAHGSRTDPEGRRVLSLERLPENDRYGCLGVNTFGFVPLFKNPVRQSFTTALARLFSEDLSPKELSWYLGLKAKAKAKAEGSDRWVAPYYGWIGYRGNLPASDSSRTLLEARQERAEALGASVASWEKGKGLETAPFRIPLSAMPEQAVSVIIPFRDQADLTLQTLRSLQAQKGVSEWEIVLVDNGSNPSERDEIHRGAEGLFGSDPVTLLSDPGTFNFARLNNLGVRSSHCPQILFLNNDIELTDPDSVAQMLGLASWPQVGLVGPHLHYPDGKLQSAGIKFGFAGPQVLRDPPDRVHAFREVDGMPFACVVCPRSVFEEVGGLDETVCPNGFGDAVFSHRVTRAGYSILATPLVRAIHHESKSRGRRPEDVERVQMHREGIPLPLNYDLLIRNYRAETEHLTRREKVSLSKRIYRATRAFLKVWRNP